MKTCLHHATRLLAFFFCALLTQSSLALPTYTLSDLGDVPGGAPDSIGWSVNGSGQVAGAGFYTDAKNHPFLWQPNTPNSNLGSQIDLGTLPDSFNDMWGYSINDFGQISGPARAYDTNGAFTSFLWTPNTAHGTSGHFINLGDLPGRTNGSFAFAINSHGQVVGRSLDNTQQRAFLWTPDAQNGETGSMVDLGRLPGATHGASGHAINARG